MNDSSISSLPQDEFALRETVETLNTGIDTARHLCDLVGMGMAFAKPGNMQPSPAQVLAFADAVSMILRNAQAEAAA